ncbi:ADAMTS-like protein 5 [Puma concolor]|uniref:ADAMTS-like protein 5 n=1 Tax=Puma concolor TaxID=9696 RepID=A0A6P6H9Z3_PUMCO|nr:ADAMTS-like protein 5 [Puma concolor]
MGRCGGVERTHGQSAGCDGLLGSDAREDHCGRCGGANESCLFVQRVFRDSGAFAGYWNVTLIPEGARHIRVAHRSRNHLALIGVDGRHVLNGNWAVSPPGTYEAAGTRVVYTRAAGPEETLRAAGPTSQDLLLQVLLQEPNPGIEFEFWLPRERYGPFQAQAQTLGWSLRQPQPREVEPQPAEAPAAPAAGSPRTAPPAPDPCSPCPDTRGRAHRLLHYCGGDFAEAARPRILGLRPLLILKASSAGSARLSASLSSPSSLPPVEQQEARLLTTVEGHPLDRLLLPHTGYARAWSPAEDSRVRLAARHCPA